VVLECRYVVGGDANNGHGGTPTTAKAETPTKAKAGITA
jgi:hypothetical protein